ncbi:hypothetical protein CPLU01_02917 [Colletotrichum plurivorum]|uniref:Uncharacterized protein n=1 Tax=Colletotrichum plurivorum TaxID=2175906 RepID=A0A8H6KTU0_9PEZI|nr:hypothetical protein CPLU01_02917 [Colletotrichum plurivorum]
MRYGPERGYGRQMMYICSKHSVRSYLLPRFAPALVDSGHRTVSGAKTTTRHQTPVIPLPAEKSHHDPPAHVVRVAKHCVAAGSAGAAQWRKHTVESAGCAHQYPAFVPVFPCARNIAMLYHAMPCPPPPFGPPGGLDGLRRASRDKDDPKTTHHCRLIIVFWVMPDSADVPSFPLHRFPTDFLPERLNRFARRAQPSVAEQVFSRDLVC